MLFFSSVFNCSDKDPKYYIFPFYKVKTMDAAVRKMKESYFIDVFQPKLNKHLFEHRKRCYI